jgi:hypothetical protein
MGLNHMTTDTYTLDQALDLAEATTSTIGEVRDADLARQLSNAKKNPRSLRAFLDALTEMCTLNEDVAASCTYSLPRGGKRLVGPSVRFAELIVATYGNLQVGVTILDVDDDAAVVSGYVLDLEKNTRTEVPSRRRVTKKRNAAKADEDMKNLAVAVASAVAYRNAVFKGVPRALWEGVWYLSQQAATGKGTMSARRKAALDLYAQMGGSPDQVLIALGRKGEEDITLEDLAHLRGMVTAIRSGDLDIADALRPPEPEAPRSTPGKISRSPAAERIRPPSKPEPIATPQDRERPPPPDTPAGYDPETGEVDLDDLGEADDYGDAPA